MKRSDLKEATFWNDTVCLTCEEVLSDPLALECPECGGEDVIQAKKLLRFIDRFDSEEEDLPF